MWHMPARRSWVGNGAEHTCGRSSPPLPQVLAILHGQAGGAPVVGQLQCYLDEGVGAQLL